MRLPFGKMNFDIPQCYLHCKEIENKTITHDHFLQCKKLGEIQEHRIATINGVMLKSKISVSMFKFYQMV